MIFIPLLSKLRGLAASVTLLVGLKGPQAPNKGSKCPLVATMANKWVTK